MDEGNQTFINQHFFHKLIFNVMIVLLIIPLSPPSKKSVEL